MQVGSWALRLQRPRGDSRHWLRKRRPQASVAPADDGSKNCRPSRMLSIGQCCELVFMLRNRCELSYALICGEFTAAPLWLALIGCVRPEARSRSGVSGLHRFGSRRFVAGSLVQMRMSRVVICCALPLAALVLLGWGWEQSAIALVFGQIRALSSGSTFANMNSRKEYSTYIWMIFSVLLTVVWFWVTSSAGRQKLPLGAAIIPRKMRQNLACRASCMETKRKASQCCVATARAHAHVTSS